MKRRTFLTATSAASASLLSGCVTPKGSGLLGSIESGLTEAAMGLANRALTDSAYLALGIPNRSAFVTGHPLSERERRAALQARALFVEADALAAEVPQRLDIFDFRASPQATPGLTITTRAPDAWDGNTAKGRRQIEQARAALVRHRGKPALSFHDIEDLLKAHRPFLVGARLMSEYLRSPSFTRRVIVPPRSVVNIPLKTGCLGAGLPLPRAGEGARLIHVGAAVAPEHREAVYGLLAYSRNHPEAQLECQYLIWALVHADNNSFTNLSLRVSRERQRQILDAAVPGGAARYQALLEAGWARREEEARKLRMASLAIAQLNNLAGTSFQLTAPSGAVPGTPAYTEGLLRQGFDHGTDELAQLAAGLAGRAVQGAVQDALRGLNLGSVLGASSASAVQRAANDSAQQALRTLSPELAQSLLASERSPFDHLAGYTSLAPGVAAHLVDVGGTAGSAQLRVVNSTAEPFDFHANELGALTPRRVQAQALWPDIERMSGSSQQGARGRPPYSASEQSTLEGVLITFRGFFETALIKGLDASIYYGAYLAGSLTQNPRLKNMAVVLRVTPVLGNAIALHDTVNFLRVAAMNRINGTDHPALDAFGAPMDWADFVFSAMSIGFSGFQTVRGAQGLNAAMRSGVNRDALAVMSEYRSASAAIEWAGAFKTALTSEPFMEGIRVGNDMLSEGWRALGQEAADQGLRFAHNTANGELTSTLQAVSELI